MYASLSITPLVLPDGTHYTADDFAGQTVSMLYGAPAWGGDAIPWFFDQVAALWTAIVGKSTVRPAAVVARLAEGPRESVQATAVAEARQADALSPTGPERRAQYSTLCSDSFNPTLGAAWMAADRALASQGSKIGGIWLWSSRYCAAWPQVSSAAYRGSFSNVASVPLLVLGAEHDPASPWTESESIREVSPHASFVEVKGLWGHGVTYWNKDAASLRNDFILSGKVPGTLIVLSQPGGLFPTP